MLAGCHVELPAVPRAGHHGTSQCPFAQRSTRVRAHTIHGVELPIDIIHSEDTTSCDHLPTGTGRQFSGVDERYQRHGSGLDVVRSTGRDSEPISSESSRQLSKVLGSGDFCEHLPGEVQSTDNIQMFLLF